MTNLTIGDIVIAKHNNIWQKGCITKINSHPYYSSFYITFDKESVETLYIPYNRAEIIKVGSDFNMSCGNCKHCEKYDFEEPCYKCLGSYSYWEPCDSLKNKDKLNGNDIKTFSIDEGHFTDKKVDYSYISTSRSKTVTMLERGMYEQLLASPLRIEKLDMESFYPDFCTKSMNRPILHHSDDIDALRYYMDDVRATSKLMADFNKKENKNMKKQQKKRDRNIIKVKDLETRKIKEIMFNGPATIIKWNPTWTQVSHNGIGDKTVTVCKEPDKLDKTTGFLLAVLKEVLTNQSYGNILEKIDEFSKPTVEPELHHCSIKDLKERTEALENAYIPGSVVKYNKYGKKYYMVLGYKFDEDLKEMVYILRPYRGNYFVNSGLEDTRKMNVPHSKLIMIRRK